MRKTIIMALAAVVMAACTAKPVQEGWVKVEGNKFVDPNGNEIVFRGLCFSDPVTACRSGSCQEPAPHASRPMRTCRKPCSMHSRSPV